MQPEKAVKEKESKERILKEGYCENCRKKYEHFDDVSTSFATFIAKTDDACLAHCLASTPKVRSHRFQLDRS